MRLSCNGWPRRPPGCGRGHGKRFAVSASGSRRVFTMRVALISDIHANEVALQAVMADIKRVGVEQIICLGDVATLGPCPGVVIQTLRDLRCPCILGNHEAFLLDPDLIQTYTEVPVVVEAVDWCRGRLSADEL